MVKEDLYVTPEEDNAVLIAAGEVLTVVEAGSTAATVGTVEELTTGATGAEDAGALATGAAADERGVELQGIADSVAASVETSVTTDAASAEAADDSP